MTPLEQAFTHELLRRLAAAAALGAAQPRLEADVRKFGGPACARRLLDRGRTSDGFAALADAGRLDLSLEALAAEGKYGALFTDDQVNACFAALCAAGYYAFGA